MKALAVLLALSSIALLVAGGLVNAYQAAGSVPDWPLSYGKLILTDWTGNTVYEHSHRLLAALVAVLMIVFVRLLRRREDRTWVVKMASVAEIFYIVQILLGGAIVLMKAPAWLSVIHVILAQVTVSMILIVCAAVLGAWKEPGVALTDDALASKLKKRLGMVSGLIVLQIILGALSRHPSGDGQHVIPLIIHLLGALVLLILLPMVAFECIWRVDNSAVRKAGMALFGFFALQLVVGVAVFLIAPEPLAEEWPPPNGFPILHALHGTIAACLMAAASSVKMGLKTAAPAVFERSRRAS